MSDLSSYPIEPEQDPSFLAFQRSLGVEEADLQSSVALRSSALQRALAMQLPDIQHQTEENVRNIGLEAASRGVFSGGNRARAQAEAYRTGEQQAQAATASTADQQAQLQQDLATQIAQYRRQAAEQELNTRSGLATDYANLQGGLY